LRRLVTTILFALTLVCTSIQAQTSSTFWLAIPYLSGHSSSATYHLLVFAYQGDADVVVNMPADPTFVSRQFTVPNNGYYDLVISDSYDSTNVHMATIPDSISNHGIKINSTKPITCYLQLTGENGEAYLPKGDNALGTDFVLMMQNSYPNYSGWTEAFSSAQIIATEDNTQVTIVPSQPGGKSKSMETVVVTLNQGQVFDYRAANQSGEGHLVGTRITATKPIVVNSTDDSVEKGGQDLSGDQIVSTEFWGYEYIAVSMRNSWEGVYVTTLTDNTEVKTGDGEIFHLNSGDIQYIPLGGVDVKFISATAPIAVFQQTGYGGATGEIGGTMLPQIECTGSQVVSYKRTFGTISTFINLITRSAYTSSLTLNGSPISSSNFHIVPGTDDEWSYCKLDISGQVAENELAIVRSSAGFFHLGAVDYTVGTSCTLGYFSDYATKAARDTADQFVCYTDVIHWRNKEIDVATLAKPTGDTLVFRDTVSLTLCDDSIYLLNLYVSPHTLYHYKDTSVMLCDGDYFPFGTQHVQHIYNSGIYYDTVRNIVGCYIEITELNISISRSTTKRVEVSETICHGESYVMNGRAFDKSGDYIDTLQQVGNGCDSIVTLHLFVTPDTYSTDTVIHVYMCEGDCFEWNGERYCDNGTFSQTLVNHLGCDSTIYLTIELVRTPYNPPFESETEFWNDPYDYIEQLKDHNPDFWNDPFIDFIEQETDNPDFWDDPYWNQLYVKDTVCDNEPAVIGGAIHKESGQYVDTLKDMYGCDSLIFLDLIVLKHSDTLLIDSMCNGDLYEWRGKKIYKVGLYSDTVANMVGCDSIITLELRSKADCSCDTAYTTIYRQIDEKDIPYSWDSHHMLDRVPQNEGQDTTFIYKTVKMDATCDSIATLHLHVLFPCELPATYQPVYYRKE